MPRKDRRFKGQDLRRLYCRNLTPLQRRFFDITECDWEDLDAVEQTQKILEFLEESGLLEEAILLLPYGHYVVKVLNVAQFLLGGGALSEVDWIPGLDHVETERIIQGLRSNLQDQIDDRRDEIMDALEQDEVVKLLEWFFPG